MASSLPSLSGAEIRQTFLDFYQQRSHKILPSASLIPEDPTVLLTIAGMLQFKPIFLGQRAAEVPRATTRFHLGRSRSPLNSDVKFVSFFCLKIELVLD